MPASTILLLDSDADAGQAIAAILTGAGYTVTTTADADEAFAKAADQQLVIIDVAGGPRSAVEICREIRATPALSAIPVMCVSATEDVEERIAFLEAGADDVMARPFDAREMEARVEALLLRFQRSKDLAPVVSADGLTLSRARRTVAVYSPKGGVGTTTVATNIAIAAARHRPDKVILVDFALQFGGVAVLLNLDPKQTIADVVRDDVSREPDLLRTYAMRHDSGLHVLAAPAAPEVAETITRDHVSQILTTLLESYDLVVIDAGSTLDERVLTIFENAESVLLPITPEIGALKSMHALLEYMGEAGTIATKSTFVLNTLFAREILKLRDVESFLGAKIAVELPYDPFLYLKAVNEGVPIVTGASRSIAAERLVKLSSIAFGDGHYPLPSDVEPKKSGGLFRRRR
ncbi:MAG TPA: AAA family ATPase [Candidatus Limnocylindrales bacterium]|nr:AAA family ATPase [Candidatus Limnocylindrales bacterium]